MVTPSRLAFVTATIVVGSFVAGGFIAELQYRREKQRERER
jgi:hypothetical protein